MSSIEELVAQHQAQGILVAELKAAKDPSVKEAVTKLLDIKKAIAVIDPAHEFAMKKKEKKKKKKKATNPDGTPMLSKKELRIKAKQEAARKKEQELAAKQASATNYGDARLVQSHEITGRTWTRLEHATGAMNGKKVLMRARIHTVRLQSKNAFLVLRQGVSTLQCVVTQSDQIPKEMLKFIAGTPVESVVDVEGTLTAVPNPITSCTQSDIELHITSFHVISKAELVIPFQVASASMAGSYQYGETDNDGQSEAKDDAGVIKIGLDVRLDNRVIDMRTPCSQSILRINTGVSNLFRQFLYERDFVEIHTPKLNGGASEGGANCFTLEYFGEKACLAQSPQLFKQMTAGCGGLERVFEVGPVFRAEDSNTHRHLCEFTGLDMEMAINEHYFEVLEMFSDIFINIFEGLNSKYSNEIKEVQKMFPADDFKFLKPSLRLTYAEGCKLLNDYTLTESDIARGCTAQDPEEDLSTPNEKLLGRIVKAKYNTDFFMMDEYPLKIRPFYTMPHPDNPKLSNSYDFFMRGEEILSGAQRIHDVELLLKRCRTDGGHGEPMTEEAIDSIKGYIDAFRHGALPHGGGGVGLERVVMLFLGLPNIRLASFFPRDPKRLAP
jgi:aspartyl-tRNA synthetase